MPTTIYLITDGPSDERYISATFSTRAAADAALRLASDEAAVEEYPVDMPLPDRPSDHFLWMVSREGDHTSAMRISAFLDRDAIGHVSQHEGAYYVSLWARDAEHALAMGRELIERAKG